MWFFFFLTSIILLLIVGLFAGSFKIKSEPTVLAVLTLLIGLGIYQLSGAALGDLALMSMPVLSLPLLTATFLIVRTVRRPVPKVTSTDSSGSFDLIGTNDPISSSAMNLTIILMFAITAVMLILKFNYGAHF